jgi:uridine kinase
MESQYHHQLHHDASTATEAALPAGAVATAATASARPPRPPALAAPASRPSSSSFTPKRPPPFVIGVAGGTASGKTTVCERIMQRLNDKSVVLVSQDAFYRPLNDSEREAAARNNFDFDAPEAFDTELLLECLATLAEGRPFDCPVYDFVTHARKKAETRRVDPADVIVVEGILVLAIPRVRDACSLRVYVDTDDDVRLARRIQRDVAVRGRDVAGVIAQYQRFVKPCFERFVSPSRRHADVIVPWHDGFGLGAGGVGRGAAVGQVEQQEEGGSRSGGGGGGGGGAVLPFPVAGGDAAGGATGGARGGGKAAASGSDGGGGGNGGKFNGGGGNGGGNNGGGNNNGGNIVAIDLLEQHVRGKLTQHPLRRLFPMLSIMQPSFQLVGMLTILRDASTPKEKFVFFADRVIRLVVEAGLGHLPFAEKTVVTPTGHRYVGVEFCRGICGVSVIRSGEAMETALRACCHGVKIGKLLVARHARHHHAHGAGVAGGGGGGGGGGGAADVSAAAAGGAASLSSRPGSSGAAAGGGSLGGFVARIDELTSPSPAPSPLPAAANGGGGGGNGLPRQLSASSPSAAAPHHPLNHNHNHNGSSLVIYEKLPRDIADRHVLLMDPVLTTGHTATKAVETLLAKGVSEERIIFLSILASPSGVARLCGAHPRLRLVTAEIDEGVDGIELVPGMGEFGQRYYS